MNCTTMTKGKRSANSKLWQPWQENVKRRKTDAAQQETKPSVDENGHLVCRAEYKIKNKFNIEAVLGEGAFGRVIRVKDMDTLESKAMKTFRNEETYRQGAYFEIHALQLIAQKDFNDTSLCIKILEWFDYHDHICIVFDALGMNVYDFMRYNNFKPYSLKEVRHIAYQLCHAVKFLHGIGIIHTDIKPENLVFVDSSTFGENENKRLKSTEIRLIDFGGAARAKPDEIQHNSIITTRYYRAPEVVLELGWTQSCDVWSIACSIFEMCCGQILFPTADDDIHHLLVMEEILGPVPQRMASGNLFIEGKLNSNEKFDDEYVEICDQVKEWLNNSEADDLGDLLKQMLAYEPTERIEIEAAYNHPFFDDMPNHPR